MAAQPPQSPGAARSIPGALATLLGFAAIFGSLSLWRGATASFPWLVLGVLIGSLLVLGLLARAQVLRSAALTGTWVGALWALLIGMLTGARVTGDQDATFIVALVGALAGLGAGMLVTGSRLRLAGLTDSAGRERDPGDPRKE